MKARTIPQSPLFTDLYQLTMAYAYWKDGRADNEAVFDYFFRECPFGGEFAIFAGLGDLLDFVENFRFRQDDIDYLKSVMPMCSSDFFDWLSSIDASRLAIYSFKEGSVAFPKVPLVRVEGPIAIAQMLETPILNLCNFPSLITTNAARYRLAAGKDKQLLEFGLRRAQDAMRASYYSWIGGFNGTSNVLAAKDMGIAPKGTMAHSFVSSFSGLSELPDINFKDSRGEKQDFAGTVSELRKTLKFENTNDGELSAFIAYARAFPSGFLALVDTYDTLKSGVPNFLCVALALHRFGYKPVGIRLDSGDLAYLSREARKMFKKIDNMYDNNFTALTIAASNDINEETLYSLKEQFHEIDTFGIGTHLVTCQNQPAFGGVYKLVSVNSEPRIKLSEQVSKLTIPGRKSAYRLIGEDGKAILDLMMPVGDDVPRVSDKILCRHPFAEAKRVYVVPSQVILLHNLVWDGEVKVRRSRSPSEIRDYVESQLALLREDHLRRLNPTPYKVSISDRLYQYMHNLWLKNAQIAELK